MSREDLGQRINKALNDKGVKDVDDIDYRTESIKALILQLDELIKLHPEKSLKDEDHVAVQHARSALRIMAGSCIYGSDIHIGDFIPFCIDLILACPDKSIRMILRDAINIAFIDMLEEAAGGSTIRNHMQMVEKMAEQALQDDDLMDTIARKIKGRMGKGE